MQEEFWLRFVLSALLSAYQNRPGRVISQEWHTLVNGIVRIGSHAVKPIFALLIEASPRHDCCGAALPTTCRVDQNLVFSMARIVS